RERPRYSPSAAAWAVATISISGATGIDMETSRPPDVASPGGADPPCDIGRLEVPRTAGRVAVTESRRQAVYRRRPAAGTARARRRGGPRRGWAPRWPPVRLRWPSSSLRGLRRARVLPPAAGSADWDVND